MDDGIKRYLLQCLEVSKSNAEELAILSDRFMTKTEKTKASYCVDAINIVDLIEIVKQIY